MLRSKLARAKVLRAEAPPLPAGYFYADAKDGDNNVNIVPEGFREPERFSALKKAFAGVSAVQCGFCIPGMILAAEALLNKNAAHTEAEIREGLSGSPCRCTGYNAIVSAVSGAAKEGTGLWCMDTLRPLCVRR